MIGLDVKSTANFAEYSGNYQLDGKTPVKFNQFLRKREYG
jgi:hypothetical protein